MKLIHLILAASCCASPSLVAQDAMVGQAPFGPNGSNELPFGAFPGGGSARQLVILTSNAASKRSFNLVTTTASGRTSVGPSGCAANTDIFTRDGEQIVGQIGCSNFKFQAGGVNNTYYVFKTPTAANSDTFIFWRLSAPIRAVNNVTSNVSGGTVSSGSAVTVTATLGAAQPTNNGQNMYVWYSLDNFTSSNLVKMTDNNNGTFTGTIPAQTGAATVQYKLITSAASTTNPTLTPANASLRTLTSNDNGGSNFSYAVASPALPVTWTEWSGRREPDGVALNWATGSEADNEAFDVERSSDSGGTWTHVASVPGRNLVGGSRYAYSDRSAPRLPLVYRLRQRDFDGASAYSPLLRVKAAYFAGDNLQVWPQPANGGVLWLNGGGHGGRLAHFYDGRGVRRLSVRLTGRVQRVQADRLPAGLYFLKLEDSDAAGRIVVLN